MSEEPNEAEVVEPPVVVDVPQDDPPPAQAPVAPAPEPEPKTYNVDIEGRTETVSGEEYDYLAKLGAQALIASQHQQQAAMAPPAQPEEKWDESMMEETSDSEMMDRRMTNIEQQLHNHKLGQQIEGLKRDVEQWIKNSEVMDAVHQMEGGPELMNEVRREVFNKCSQEHMPAQRAFTAVESKWAKVMGEERSQYLLKKLKVSNEAAPGTGGASPTQATPFSAGDWGDGSMLDSITERLTNSES